MKFSDFVKTSPVNWKDLAEAYRDSNYNVLPREGPYEKGIRVILRGQLLFANLYLDREIYDYTFTRKKMLRPIWRDAGWQEMTLTPCPDGKVSIQVELNFLNAVFSYLIIGAFVLFLIFYFQGIDFVLNSLSPAILISTSALILLFMGSIFSVYYLSFFIGIRREAINFLHKTKKTL